MSKFLKQSIFAATFILGYSCGSENQPKKETAPAVNTNSETDERSGKVFELLSHEQTGVDFSNVLQEDEDVNFFKYQYLYNGGGVGIGDINNDGLPDLYFTGTLDNDRLYLNQGNLNFKDITLEAGIQQNNGLKTGVSMVDLNNDGYLDIYVSRSGWYEQEEKRANLLYINQGDGSFQEEASKYGLAETGHTVQVGFFDYDKDGDLDCYMANHPLFEIPAGEFDEHVKNPPEQFRDKLYQNNGDNTFTEVSKAAGINNYGHGLGLAISDYNQDGWPDVYVANDFRAHDFYYINNGDGTFTERAKSLTSHVSRFAMGSDAADINNDGMLDLFVVEMLAEDNKRQKTNMASMNPNLFWSMVQQGHHYQFMRNTLQLNLGRGSFSEIAYFSGLTNTDWSWAPLFADFDHDGHKDLAITNGYLKDTQDKDLAKKVKGKGLNYTEVVSLIKSTRISNYVFKNEGDLRFSNRSADWGFNFSGFSNGMAYGDLDNDGDLDLVVNNFNEPASVYKNTISDRKVGQYLMLSFNGPAGNRNGLGTKLRLTTEAGEQFQEFWVARGFESSCDYKVHFGLDKGDRAKELLVEWPDGKTQRINEPALNQLLQLNYTDADGVKAPAARPKPLFRHVGGRKGFLFTHKENAFNDYEKEILLPHKQSQNGPKITVGDVNRDGLDDFHIGGAAGQAGMLVIQMSNGRFASSSEAIFAADAIHEDLGGTFFDADNDGDLDLYVVSGGNEFEPNSAQLQDRIYLNDGKGVFVKAPRLLPPLYASGGCVSAADFDGDGDQDLFVGGRIVPGKYPFAPRSYVLRNDGYRFTDVTENVAPELLSPGLITSAAWADFTGDGRQDLVLVGEWTGILLFENEGGELEYVSENYGLDQESGWWNKVLPVDLDQDGDLDFVLGNLGLNYKYVASKEEPFEVYAHDFDESGSIDIVLGYYNDGTCYPVRGRQCSSEQMPMITEKFKSYDAFGDANLQDVYGDKLKDALHLKAHNFASSILLNQNGSFELKALPSRAQFAPINGIVASDFNQDGHTDLIVAGNLFQAEVETGRADAGRGLLLLGNGQNEFEPKSILESGINLPLDVKDLQLLNNRPGQAKMILAGNNNYGLQLLIENTK